MLSTSKPAGYGSPTTTFYPVVIIGAGMGGIGMACQLKEKLGFDQFRVLERQSGIGGTWWINRYPGVACDIPAIFYSFSFCQNSNWSSFFPSGEEILRYQQSVVEKYQLIDKIQLNSDVALCRWDVVRDEWEITVRHLAPGMGDHSAAERQRLIDANGAEYVYVSTEMIRCKSLVSAVGGLVEPNGWPSNVPGKEQFMGDVYHSARWNINVDLSDKSVLVIGAGCSAAQIVPKLLAEKGAKKVTQIMREPPWIVPRPEPPLGYDWWRIVFKSVPGSGNLMRKVIAGIIDSEFVYFGTSTASRKARKELETDLLLHLQKMAPEKYHEILTPRYDSGCKRRVYDTDWLSSLGDPRFDLTTLSLQRVNATSVVLGPSEKTHSSEAAKTEREIPCDVIILANGFQVTRWFHPLEIVGLKNESLTSVFEKRGGPQMYKGTAMDGFPNLFVLFGPNSFTGHSSVIFGLENQIGHAIQLMRPLLRKDASRIEVRKEAQFLYNQQIQSALEKMVWNTGGCSSWYTSKDGHNSVNYPYSMVWQVWEFLYPRWSDWNVSLTAQGRRRRATRALSRLLIISMVVYLAVYNSHWKTTATKLLRALRL